MVTPVRELYIDNQKRTLTHQIIELGPEDVQQADGRTHKERARNALFSKIHCLNYDDTYIWTDQYYQLLNYDPLMNDHYPIAFVVYVYKLYDGKF